MASCQEVSLQEFYVYGHTKCLDLTLSYIPQSILFLHFYFSSKFVTDK